jgi:ribonuclease D
MLLNAISVYYADIPLSMVETAREVGAAALDIETSGLDWKEDRIATCQVYVPDRELAVVRVDGSVPKNLGLLLGDQSVCKLFHHAMFDLRFMAYKWSVQVQRVRCTKIASKILSPSKGSHSLKPLVREYLGVELDKTMQTSDWLVQDLSQEQLEYAAGDVFYLPLLFDLLQDGLRAVGRWSLAQASFQYLPIRVQLDILGSGDVFTY